MTHWQPADYSLCEPSSIGSIFDRVWRTDLAAPGFCVIDLGPVGSRELRSAMVELHARLGDLLERRTGERFAARTAGRFDQQETTKFHLDGAPELSMLVLGYEPTGVTSRLFLADYSRAAYDLGRTPREFLAEFNPMFRSGEDRLAGYVTEVPEALSGHARIVLVNNSSRPYTPGGTDSLGVLHKAEVPRPTEAEQRVVNSMLLAVDEADRVAPEQLREFVETDRLSPKVNA